MSIESEAQHDLELSDDSAEGVAGGRAVAKKKAAPKAKHGAAVASFTVQGSSTAGADPGTPAGQSWAELESDPDC